MKPHPFFNVVRADEVAECWDGVTDELYKRLWSVLVPQQRPIPNIEDNGPADVVGIGCVAENWGLLTEEEQSLLNTLAAAQEERI